MSRYSMATSSGTFALVLTTLLITNANASTVNIDVKGIVDSDAYSNSYDNIGVFGGGSLVGSSIELVYAYDPSLLSLAATDPAQYLFEYHVSNPSTFDGTLTATVGGDVIVSSLPIQGLAEFLYSGLHYAGSGFDGFLIGNEGYDTFNNTYDVSGSPVPGQLLVQSQTNVASYTSDFLINLYNPTLPSVTLTTPDVIAPYENFIAINNDNAIGPGVSGDLLVYNIASITVVSSVPEPITWTLMLIGLGGIGSLLRVARRVPLQN